MKIMVKNFVFTTLLIFIVTTVSLGVLYFVMPTIYERNKRAQILQETVEISQKINHLSLNEMIKNIEKQYKNKRTDVFLTIINSEDEIIYPNMRIFLNLFYTGEADEANADAFDENEMDDIFKSQSFIYDLKDDKGEQFKLKAEYSLQPISEASQVLLLIYPFLLAGTLLIGAVAAYLYSEFSTKRIKKISYTTNQMLSLDRNIQCDVQGKDEIALLAKDINQLDQTLLNTIEALKEEVTKVEEIERSKTEFMRITSHELKTPISAMMGIIDGMIYKVGKFKNHEYYLSVCKEILENQTQLIQNILTVSKLDIQTPEYQEKEIFDMKKMLQETLKTYEILADANQINFQINLEECQVTGFKEEVVKVLNNLLSNAMHYVKERGTIVLQLHNDYLIIENQVDQVLSKEELTKIFAPFYRPDFSRDRQSGGTGLGLFIVQKILEQHNWHFSFEAVDKEKMRFTIFF